MDAKLLRSQLDRHESALKGGYWPIQDSLGADLFLDVGLDPSLHSSGICVILRSKDQVLSVKTLRQTTDPQDPTPLRFSIIMSSIKTLMLDTLGDSSFNHLHITLLFEQPPTMLSSSGWLFALNQFLWVSLGADSELGSLGVRGNITFNQFAINVSQFKSLYLDRSSFYNLDFSFREIKKSKKVLKDIINRILQDIPEISKLLPKKFNHDVAESIILAACAGACSRINDFSEANISPLYPAIPHSFLYALMTNKAVNKNRERLGWLYRPLEHSFSWQIPIPE